MRGSVALLTLGAAFATLLAVATVFFHYSEQLDWITALYFVVTMATTTGFGDISLRTSSVAAKILGIVTMLSAMAFVSVFFSLLFDRIVARRTENILGRRRHRLAGHVIVCGLGRVGYHLVERLRAENYPVLVIEKDADNQFLASKSDSMRVRSIHAFASSCASSMVTPPRSCCAAPTFTTPSARQRLPHRR